MVHVQTGNMLDVIVEGKSLGLKKRGEDDVFWLVDPKGLVDVLSREIQRTANGSHPPTQPDDRENLLALRQQVEDTIAVAQTEEQHGFITAYHFQTGAIHRLLAEARKGDKCN